MKRETFLQQFPGVLGYVDIQFSDICAKSVKGDAIHDTSDAAFNLITLLKQQQLLSIDLIIVDRTDLRARSKRKSNYESECWI